MKGIKNTREGKVMKQKGSRGYQLDAMKSIRKPMPKASRAINPRRVRLGRVSNWRDLMNGEE